MCPLKSGIPTALCRHGSPSARDHSVPCRRTENRYAEGEPPAHALPSAGHPSDSNTTSGHGPPWTSTVSTTFPGGDLSPASLAYGALCTVPALVCQSLTRPYAPRVRTSPACLCLVSTKCELLHALLPGRTDSGMSCSLPCHTFPAPSMPTNGPTPRHHTSLHAWAPSTLCALPPPHPTHPTHPFLHPQAVSLSPSCAAGDPLRLDGTLNISSPCHPIRIAFSRSLRVSTSPLLSAIACRARLGGGGGGGPEPSGHFDPLWMCAGLTFVVCVGVGLSCGG